MMVLKKITKTTGYAVLEEKTSNEVTKLSRS